MTKRDFFRLVIKLFGLYTIIKSLLIVLPSSLTLLVKTSYSSLGYIAWFIGIILGAFALFILLIYKADTVINWLKLDKGFDDNEMSIANMNIEKLLTLGLIIIGGLLFINNISSFFAQILSLIKTSSMYKDPNNHMNFISNLGLITSLTNTILGYFLVVYSSKFAKRIGKINNMSKTEKED